MYDLKHADDSLGDTAPKADRALRVAIRDEEDVEVEWYTMYCLRDVTQGAEALQLPRR